MKTANYGWPILALTLLLGCEKQAEPNSAPAEKSEAAQAAAPVVADKPPASATVATEQVPAEEQFEQEAEQEVTAANFELQVDALQKELKSE